MKHRILLLAYLYYSDNSTVSVRSFEFAQAFSRVADACHVVTSDQPPAASSVITHTISAFSLKKYLKKDTGTSIVSESHKQSRLFQWIFQTTKSFPLNIFLAEANILYILRAYKYCCRLIEKEGITTIYSSYIPYGDHYIAYLLKSKYPHLKWVADFRDLYVEPMYKDVWCPNFQKKIEKHILAKANIVTTVSEGLVNHLKAFGRPTYAIMRGIRPRAEQEQYPIFTISYTGSLFKDFRDPRPLFALLQEMLRSQEMDKEDIQVVYAGKDSPLFSEWITAYGLSPIYVDRGMLSRKEAQDIQDRSHINLLLTSSSAEWQGVLTGKVFEYFASGNATLCLIKGVRDEEFERLFRTFRAGAVVYDPPVIEENMKSFLLSKYHQWKRDGYVSREVNTQILRDHHGWDARVHDILRLLS